MDVLRIGLRSRAATVGELAELVGRDPDDVRDHLVGLAERGYLELRGDQIVYDVPDRAVARLVRHATEALGADVAERLRGMAEVLDELPALTSAWNATERAGELFDVEVFHGPSAVTDLWHVLVERQPLRRTDVMLPDASPIFVADPAMQKVWHDVIRMPGNRARVLARVADATHPDAAERLGQELAAGVEIRLLPEPPSWFWVADAEVVALPMAWGETWPTSVMAVRSPAVAGLAQWMFEGLWRRAIDVAGDDHGWDPLLRLVQTGVTLETASRMLGISERTGRRRLSDAMEHYGVNNMLALGAAWGAQQG